MLQIDYRKYPLPRLRHHASAYLYIPLAQLRVRPRGYPPVPEQLNWSELFANGAPPTCLDVGCGLGRFLLNYAVLHPQENILGLEVRKKAVEWLDTVIRGEGIGNAAVLWYSVVNGFPFLASDSIEHIFYLFPDPWPKKRHHKRRALTPEVLREFFHVLRPGGQLWLATDVAELDEYHCTLLHEHGGFECEEVHDDSAWGLPLSDQELFCRQKGIPYVRRRCRKR
jgi:tRNA (guanine-N7-)-methyltransferase